MLRGSPTPLTPKAFGPGKARPSAGLGLAFKARVGIRRAFVGVCRSRWLRLGALLGGCALLWSCVAPILTVPPPSQIGFTSAIYTASDGTSKTLWTTTGGPIEQAAGATFYILDQAVHAGVIATAGTDGSFVAPPMEGTAKDRVTISYKTPGGDFSDSICVLLTAGSVPPLCPE